MLTSLRYFLLLAVLALSAARPAAASHLQGGDLTYASLGNNRYRVTLRAYRDCSATVANPTFALACRTGSCNTPATVTATMVQQGSATVGRQYCAALSGLCTTSGLTNSEAITYIADVTLPPAAQWVLSVSECCRPTVANLVNRTTSDFYMEATLHNLLPMAGTTGLAIANTSAVASTLPVLYVPQLQHSSLTNSAFDADGDSLVYSLQAPLDYCSGPVGYATYPQSPIVGPIVGNPPCFIQAATIANYSATLPIHVAQDTSGQCPLLTATPSFYFNASTGSITLRPNVYRPSASNQGLNKYAAVVKISEYRRLNGAYVLVGTTRRELYFEVYNGSTNLLPRFASNVTVQTGAQNTVQPLSRIIPVAPGQAVSVLLNATDANASQVLTHSLTYNAMPGTSLQNLGGGQARLTFTPSTTLSAGLYRVAVTAEDDACPVKGLESQVLTFRVLGGALATRATTVLAVAAYPNPFTDQVQFQLAKPGVQIITICDNLGRTVATVHSQPDGTVRWQPAPELPAGLYLARPAGSALVVRLLHHVAP